MSRDRFFRELRERETYRQMEDGVLLADADGSNVFEVRVNGREHTLKGLGGTWFDADNAAGEDVRVSHIQGSPYLPQLFSRGSKPRNIVVAGVSAPTDDAQLWTWEGGGGDFGYTYGGSQIVSRPSSLEGAELWIAEGKWEPWTFFRVGGVVYTLAYSYTSGLWAPFRVDDGVQMSPAFPFGYGEMNFSGFLGSFVVQDFNDYSVFRLMDALGGGVLSANFSYKRQIFAYWVLFRGAVAWTDDYTRLTVAPILQGPAGPSFSEETEYLVSTDESLDFGFNGFEYPRTIATDVMVGATADAVDWETKDEEFVVKYSRSYVDGYVPPTSAAPYSPPDAYVEEFIESNPSTFSRTRRTIHLAHVVDNLGRQSKFELESSAAGHVAPLWPGAADIAESARDDEFLFILNKHGIDFAAADYEWFRDPRLFPDLRLDLTNLIQGGYPGYGYTASEWLIAVEGYAQGGTWERSILFQSELGVQKEYTKDHAWLYHGSFAGYNNRQRPQTLLVTAMDNKMYVVWQMPGLPVLSPSSDTTPSAVVARRWKGTKSGRYRWDAESILVVHDFVPDFDTPPEGDGQANISVGGILRPSTACVVQGYPGIWHYLHTYKGGSWLRDNLVNAQQPTTLGLKYLTYGPTLRRDFFDSDPGTEFYSGTYTNAHTGCHLVKVLRYQNTGGNVKWLTSEAYQYELWDTESAASDLPCANLIDDFEYKATWEPVPWVLGGSIRIACLEKSGESLSLAWSKDYSHQYGNEDGALPPFEAFPQNISLAPGKNGLFVIFRYRDESDGATKWWLKRLVGGVEVYSQILPSSVYWRAGHDPELGDWILVQEQSGQPGEARCFLFGESGLVGEFLADGEITPLINDGLGFQVWVADGGIYFSSRSDSETIFYKFN